MKLFAYPTQIAPRTLLALISGPIRYESTSGEQSFADTPSKLILNERPYMDSKGETWSVAHAQKKSRFFFLVQWPLCFHLGLFAKLQEQDANGGWKPGTEWGKYFRLGLWRYDRLGTKIGDTVRHWIGPLTIYINFSFHLD